MKALTIQQPWAWAIAHGGKDVENRTWKNRHRGALLIHAAQKNDQHGLDHLRSVGYQYGLEEGAPMHTDLTRSAIIGAVELVGIERNVDSSWALPGQWHWKLAQPIAFSEPIPCKGALGLWDYTGPLPEEFFDWLKGL